MFFTGRGFAFGLDIACFGEANLGEERTYDLINENGKEGDVANDITFSAELSRFDRHTESNACLGKEGDTEVFDDVGIAFHHAGADACAEVFTNGASNDVNDADDDNGDVCKYGELKLCAADDEEEDEDGGSPAVCSFHEFFGEITDIAEYGAEHHAREKRREADVDAADVEFDAGDGNSRENECHGDRHTFTSGVEEFFAKCEEQTHHKAEHEREDDLKKGFEDDGKYFHRACADGFCDAEGDRENNETYCVVKCYDGKEDVGQRTLCLILTNDHECRCGSSCRSNSAENDRCREGEVLGHEEVETDEDRIYCETGEYRLEDTDHSCLLTDLFELGKAEFVTHRKGDEAEGDIGNDAEAMKLLGGDTDAGNVKRTKEKRTDENACYEVRGNCGKLNLFRKSGEEKTCQKSHGKA